MGLGEHPQYIRGEEIAERRSSMDPKNGLEGGPTAEIWEDCVSRKRKCHCPLPGCLFLLGIRDPKKPRDLAELTVTPAPGH